MTDDAETADTPALKDARTNPWYVLMTVAGEQDGERIDWDLHARKRRYFNGWMAQALTREEQQSLINEGRATEADLAPLTQEESTNIAQGLADRAPHAAPLDRGHPACDLAGSTFHCKLTCTGYIFSGDTNFWNVKFFDLANFENATFFGNASFINTTFSSLA